MGGTIRPKSLWRASHMRAWFLLSFDEDTQGGKRLGASAEEWNHHHDRGALFDAACGPGITPMACASYVHAVDEIRWPN